MFEAMEQIQLSPVKFTESQINEQQHQLRNKIALLINTVAIDEVTLLFFNREGDTDIDVEHQFCQIIQKPIPAIKAKQLETIQIISFCFYSMLVPSKLANLSSIELFYEKYMQKTTFQSKFVQCHQRIRKWCKNLSTKTELVTSKHTLQSILEEVKRANQTRLDIMGWKIKLCLVLFDIQLGKCKVERAQIITILKQFKKLKKQNKISTKPVLNAFKFIIKYLISTNSDLYIFFERQVKIWCQQIVDNSLIEQMKTIIQECEQMSAKSLKQATISIVQNKTSNNPKPNSKISNAINHASSEAVTGRFIRRRLSKEMSDHFKKKVDHFLKIRENIHINKSVENPRKSSNSNNYKISIKIEQKPSFSLHSASASRFTIQQGMPMIKTSFNSKVEQKQIQMAINQSSKISLLASKTANSFYRKPGSRKRKQVYQKIIQKSRTQNVITSKHLKDEMFSFLQFNQQRCSITLNEILIGQLKKSQGKNSNLKFIGASEDNQFGNLQFTFYTIFNQELATISFTIKKVNQLTYSLKCYIHSTYCRFPTTISIEQQHKHIKECTLDDFFNFISNSVIYYEALQERIDRKVTISELQAMEELMRQSKGIKLSQTQLTKLLLAVDLLQSEFFWYYTKSNYINGSRLERRKNVNFTDLSAFAVSLGKFKSDYDSCLSEIILVQNIRSLVETCIYLSHGRKIFYKQLRKIKDAFYLQVISVCDQVYKGFSRKDKRPYFKNNLIERSLIKVEHFTTIYSKQKQQQEFDVNTLKSYINLCSILQEKDVFIFFMKNIVQNFIEIKYLYRIQKYLLKINKKENYQVFDQKSIIPYQTYRLEVVTNNESLEEIKDFKPNLHSSIRHLRDILLKYCQVYDLNLSFNIVKICRHLIHIKKVAYVVHETILQNNLKILKIHKNNKRQNYSLFFYHQNPSPLTILKTAFQTRFVIVQKGKLIGNLIRKQKSQMLLSNDCSTVTKGVVRYKNSYCYFNVSQCQSIVCWRFDFYFIQKQAHYSTFVDEQIFFECLGQWIDNEQMWRQTLKQIKIDLINNCIVLHNRTFSLFRSIKKLFVYDDCVKSSLELIEHMGQLQYLIINLQMGCLSIGKVENVLFLNNNKSQSAKENIEIHNNIMNCLYYKMQTGKLQSQLISTDYFIKDKQN